jgi:hypothetical protein
MILIMESLFAHSGLVEPVDFAKRLLFWAYYVTITQTFQNKVTFNVFFSSEEKPNCFSGFSATWR